MFRRYEPHIITILHKYPGVSAFDPKPLAATTFAARLRDAITSVIEYNWPTSVDVAMLKQLWESNKLEVSYGNPVTAGPPGHGKALAKAGSVVDSLLTDRGYGPIANTEPFVCFVDNPDRPTIHALAILFAKQILTKPAKLTNVNAELLKEVSAAHDVGLTVEGDAIIML